MEAAVMVKARTYLLFSSSLVGRGAVDFVSAQKVVVEAAVAERERGGERRSRE
jgi:hypothetical protein